MREHPMTSCAAVGCGKLHSLVQLQQQGGQRGRASHDGEEERNALQQSWFLVVGLGWVGGLGGVNVSVFVVTHNCW